MTSKRIEEIQEQTAYPESMSVHEALMQVWNELHQDFNSRTCENCKYHHQGYLCLELGQGLVTSKDFGCNKWCAKDD